MTLLSFIIQIYHFCLCNGYYKSTQLLPTDTSKDGIDIHIIHSDVSFTSTEWTIQCEDQQGFHMKLSLDETWAFHPNMISTIQFKIYSNTFVGPADGYDLDFMFAPSINNQYIIAGIVLDNNDDNVIYPTCQTSNPINIASGNVNELVNVTTSNRVSNAANGNSYTDILPSNGPASNSMPDQWPVIIKLENNPITNQTKFTHTNPIWQNTQFYQTCVYTAFQTNEPIDLWLALDDPNEKLNITSFFLEYYHNDTFAPTTSSPTTVAPTTNVPTSAIPTTSNPTTNVPSIANTTGAITTVNSITTYSTYMPTVSSLSESSTTFNPTSDDISVEIDMYTTVSGDNRFDKKDEKNYALNSTNVIFYVIGAIVYCICIVCVLFIKIKKNKLNNNKTIPSDEQHMKHSEINSRSPISNNNEMFTNGFNPAHITASGSTNRNDINLEENQFGEGDNNEQCEDEEIVEMIDMVTTGGENDRNKGIKSDKDITMSPLSVASISNQSDCNIMNQNNNFVLCSTKGNPNIKDDEFIVEDQDNITNGYTVGNGQEYMYENEYDDDIVDI